MRPPLSLVAVILAVPGPTAVTVPLVLTVATLVSLDVHETPLMVALPGLIVTLSLLVSPAAMVSVLWLMVTDVTGRESAATVTLVRPSTSPLSVNTATLAVPALRPLTTPLFTCTTESLDERHTRVDSFVPGGRVGVSLMVLQVATPALERSLLFDGAVVGTV